MRLLGTPLRRRWQRAGSGRPGGARRRTVVDMRGRALQMVTRQRLGEMRPMPSSKKGARGMGQIERPRAWSRRALLKIGAGGGGALLVAACGQSATTPAPASGPAASKPAESKPADSKPAASTSGASQPAGDLTTANVTLQFMGHVAGGMNEQKAYDQILDEWKQKHPNLPVEYQVVPDAD